MKIENLSLAEIVTSRPEAAVVFEKYNLDFCCGGKKSLSEALKSDDVKLNEITAELDKIFENKTSLENDFNKFSLTQLVDYILENHHSYVKENLPLIQQHLEKVSLKHGDAYPEMRKIKILFDEIKRDFEQHMIKEEVILFPRIKKLESTVNERNSAEEILTIKGPIDLMEYEHETAGKIMDEIKTLSNNYTPPANVCTTFRLSLDELKLFESDLHRHVHLENNILFPKALELHTNLGHIKFN